MVLLHTHEMVVMVVHPVIQNGDIGQLMLEVQVEMVIQLEAEVQITLVMVAIAVLVMVVIAVLYQVL